jgi:hypothetical protein
MQSKRSAAKPRTRSLSPAVILRQWSPGKAGDSQRRISALPSLANMSGAHHAGVVFSSPNQTAGCPIFAFFAKVGGDAAKHDPPQCCYPDTDATVLKGPGFSRAATIPMNTGL